MLPEVIRMSPRELTFTRRDDGQYDIFVPGFDGKPHCLGVVSAGLLFEVIGFKVELTGAKAYNTTAKIALIGGPFDGTQLDAFRGNCYIIEYPPSTGVYYIYMGDHPGDDLVCATVTYSRDEAQRITGISLN